MKEIPASFSPDPRSTRLRKSDILLLKLCDVKVKVYQKLGIVAHWVIETKYNVCIEDFRRSYKSRCDKAFVKFQTKSLEIAKSDLFRKSLTTLLLREEFFGKINKQNTKDT